MERTEFWDLPVPLPPTEVSRTIYTNSYKFKGPTDQFTKCCNDFSSHFLHFLTFCFLQRPQVIYDLLGLIFRSPSHSFGFCASSHVLEPLKLKRLASIKSSIRPPEHNFDGFSSFERVILGFGMICLGIVTSWCEIVPLDIFPLKLKPRFNFDRYFDANRIDKVLFN